MARQKLGQHFLIKGSVLERIAAACCPGREPLVVEIGPGRGALTEKLLSRADRVVAIELDAALVGRLRGKFGDDERLEIVQGDVLATDLSQWQGAVLAGNLPYYITSPILEKSLRAGFKRAVFLIQKEVAERLAAEPGTRDFGFLTVATRIRADVRLLFEVKPGAFRPPPEVDSAVVLLTPRPLPFPAESLDHFLAFAARCFRQKRKTLRNNLAPVYGREVIDHWPEAGLRAEQVNVPGLVGMFERLARAGVSEEGGPS